MTTQSTLDTSSSLTHFLANLPAKPYCCDDFSRGLSIRPIKQAITRTHIQANTPHNLRWLIFDVDLGSDSFYCWLDKLLAEPNIICQNPDNLNCHLFYLLHTPVWINGTGRAKPEQYVNAIKTEMTAQMGADHRYTGQIAKNPLHAHWRTTELHSRTHTLSDLAGYLDLSSTSQLELAQARAERRFVDSAVNGRNDHLFSVLRFFAYERVSQYRELQASIGVSKAYDMWLQAINKESERINRSFDSLLSYSEIKSTSKSVAKWTWTNYYGGDGKDRGVMGFGTTRHNFNFATDKLSDDERISRQKAGAGYTHEQRKQSTEDKIIDAIGKLTAAGETITKAKVARIVNISRTQISMQYGRFFT